MGVRRAREEQVPHEADPEASSGLGRILAIDYGRRRLGLAISDEMGWTAAPLQTLERKGRETDLRRLGVIAREQGVRRILVGNPLRMDGTAGTMAKEAERFAGRVKEALRLPVEVVDERLTSWAADQWRSGHPEAGRGRSNDEVAAAILLEEYLGREQATAAE